MRKKNNLIYVIGEGGYYIIYNITIFETAEKLELIVFIRTKVD